MFQGIAQGEFSAGMEILGEFFHSRTFFMGEIFAGEFSTEGTFHWGKLFGENSGGLRYDIKKDQNLNKKQVLSMKAREFFRESFQRGWNLGLRFQSEDETWTERGSFQSRRNFHCSDFPRKKIIIRGSSMGDIVDGERRQRGHSIVTRRFYKSLKTLM